MATLLNDTIDFGAYMDDTDAAHKVRSTEVFVEDVIRHFHAAEEQHGCWLPWPKTRSLIRLRSGEVTLWTGYNSHGKSILLGMICMGLVQQGQGVCIASMEMKPAVTLGRMCRQAYGDRRPDVGFIREFSKGTNRRLWLYDQQGTVKAEKMLAIVRYCADQLKVGHIVIDSLMKCGMGEDDYNAQKAFVDSLTATARDHDIHVHLVAHARKPKDDKTPPGKMDVKGTGSITDQVDNVVTVWRNKAKELASQDGSNYDPKAPDAVLICDKQRNGEWEGKIPLWFHSPSGQFIENGVDGPMALLRGGIAGE
ncbi:MAG: AAA family ATPase [Rhodocyclales bacterium]|nr:AAA family ATPase [Rhodocyclales bacterium]